MAVFGVILYVILSEGSTIQYFDGRSIFIDGKDVYVAGSGCVRASDTDRPMLWVNGEAQEIGEIGNFNKASSVFVSGVNIYVAMGTNNGAELWVNGNATILSKGDNSAANSVVVQGENVYVGGQSNGKAAIWQNGKCSILGPGEVAEVILHDGHIYAVGYDGEYSNGSPCVWVDGKEHQLSDFSGHANAIVFNGNDCYIAGEVQNKAALWKNNLLVLQEDRKSFAYAVAVAGENIYIGGCGFDSDYRCIALLWKNGVCEQVPAMGYQISALKVYDNKLYVGGATHKAIPVITMDL